MFSDKILSKSGENLFDSAKMHVDLSSLEAKREKKQKLAALYPLPTRGYTSHRYVRERTRQDIQFSSQHSFLIFSCNTPTFTHLASFISPINHNHTRESEPNTRGQRPLSDLSPNEFQKGLLVSGSSLPVHTDMPKPISFCFLLPTTVSRSRLSSLLSPLFLQTKKHPTR